MPNRARDNNCELSSVTLLVATLKILHLRILQEEWGQGVFGRWNAQMAEHHRKLYCTYVTNEGVWSIYYPGLHMLLLDSWCLDWFVLMTQVQIT